MNLEGENYWRLIPIVFVSFTVGLFFSQNSTACHGCSDLGGNIAVVDGQQLFVCPPQCWVVSHQFWQHRLKFLKCHIILLCSIYRCLHTKRQRLFLRAHVKNWMENLTLSKITKTHYDIEDEVNNVESYSKFKMKREVRIQNRDIFDWWNGFVALIQICVP